MSETGALAVRFYSKELQNDFLTNKEGRPISYMADFVRIEIPGNDMSFKVQAELFNTMHLTDRPMLETIMNQNKSTDGKIIPAYVPTEEYFFVMGYEIFGVKLKEDGKE